jgi:hypothetical protein
VGVELLTSESANAQRRAQHLSVTMKLNWKSVKAAHVTRACETVLNSAGARPKPGGLIVIYKDKKLPAKNVAVITHEHQDHVNGFTATNFPGRKVGEVWFAWTEDPDDKIANRLRKKFKDRLLGLIDMRDQLRSLALDDGRELFYSLLRSGR